MSLSTHRRNIREGERFRRNMGWLLASPLLAVPGLLALLFTASGVWATLAEACLGVIAGLGVLAWAAIMLLIHLIRRAGGFRP
ncbi:hypothetical protein [Streptacidiphilus rugosus]|uniref:hypothetical protein n=1 Tax=Streptacidiphilus rugosus TaxID=405783 RepID=UPI00055BBE77|nr:hypothetical protein [Streptacidiphilus rugosus]